MSLLERLFSIGPVRKAIWQLWYPYLTRRLRSEEVLFLNYAFETDPPVGLKLDPADEPNRACIQLYHHVATQVDLQGKNVLEVSCGHGGGASWLTPEYFRFGASTLANDILRQLVKQKRGMYVAGFDFSEA